MQAEGQVMNLQLELPRLMAVNWYKQRFVYTVTGIFSRPIVKTSGAAMCLLSNPLSHLLII